MSKLGVIDYKSKIGCDQSEDRTVFRLASTPSGGYIQSIDKFYFHLIFILEGVVEFSSGDMLRKCFKKDEFFFLPRSLETYGYALEDSRILFLSFDTNVDFLCENCLLYNFLKGTERADIPFHVLHATPQVKMFQNLMEIYLTSPSISPCNYLYKLKQHELFILLTYNYTKQELTELFSPILNYDTNFKQHFFANYKMGLTIAETASKMNMSIRNFSRKFHLEFGENARDWLQNQKAKSIRAKLSMPGLTVNDIIMDYDFTDLSHFTKFCKHYYDCTPAELIRQLENENTGN